MTEINKMSMEELEAFVKDKVDNYGYECEEELDEFFVEEHCEEFNYDGIELEDLADKINKLCDGYKNCEPVVENACVCFNYLKKLTLKDARKKVRRFVLDNERDELISHLMEIDKEIDDKCRTLVKRKKEIQEKIDKLSK